MFLNENGVKCVNLNGKMPVDIRTGMLSLFQSGDVDVISCTDIGSRGINTVRVSADSLEQDIIDCADINESQIAFHCFLQE
jgi:actin-like ATPase involved in cell morphogenesis